MKIIYLIGIFSLLLSCTSSKNNEAKIVAEEVPQREVENKVEYYPNGAKKIEGRLVNGKRHGKWSYYYENGFLWSEGYYKDGVREGKSMVYYESGKKKFQGQYKNDFRVGVWRVWEEDGSIAGEVNVNKTLTQEDSLMLNIK